MKKELLLSFIIHFVVLGAAVVFGSQVDKKPAEPVVVFLSVQMPGGSGQSEGGGIKNNDFQIEKRTPSHSSKKTKIANRTITGKAVSIENKKADSAELLTTSSDMTSMHYASSAPSVSDGIPAETSFVGGGSGEPGNGGTGFGPGGSGGGGFGFGLGGRGGSGGGTGAGHGTGSGDANILSEKYLAENYAYIRDLIMKNLKYPVMAKKMGWKGKVVVAFLIKENGSVENSKIIAGSGYEVLDKNVLSVINEVQPFPKPPVKAELVIPVTYKLE